MLTTAKKARHRLEASHELREQAPPPRVDREAGFGVIRGASIATEGEALGHGFRLDKKAIKAIARLSEGKPGRWTHGNLSADGLGTHLGRWKNTETGEIEAQVGGETVTLLRAFGDFRFSEAAWSVEPESLSVPAPQHLMDMAEEDPSVLGTSIVAELAFVVLDDDGEEVAADGWTDDAVARPLSVLRADFVADPAANPNGLFSGTPSALAEAATEEIDLLVNRIGEANALAFLSRFFDRRGITLKTTKKSIKALADAALASDDDDEKKKPFPPKDDDDEESADDDDASLADDDDDEDDDEEDDDEEEAEASSDCPHCGEALSALRQTVAALTSTVAELKAKHTTRDKSDRDRYVKDLQTQATARQAPASKAQLKTIRALLKSGDRATADCLSDAILSRGAEVEGQAFRRIEKAGAPTDAPTEDDVDQRLARIGRRDLMKKGA